MKVLIAVSVLVSFATLQGVLSTAGRGSISVTGDLLFNGSLGGFPRVLHDDGRVLLGFFRGSQDGGRVHSGFPPISNESRNKRHAYYNNYHWNYGQQQNTEAISNRNAFRQDIGQLCTQSTAIECRCKQQLGELENYFPAEVQACIDGRVESATITQKEYSGLSYRHDRYGGYKPSTYECFNTFDVSCQKVNRLDCLQQYFSNNPDLNVTVSAILSQLPESEGLGVAASLCEPIIQEVADISEQVQKLYACTNRSLLRQCQENIGVESSTTTVAPTTAAEDTEPSSEDVERLQQNSYAMDYCSTPLNASLLDLTKARDQIVRIVKQCAWCSPMFMEQYIQCRSGNLPEGVTEKCIVAVERMYIRRSSHASRSCFNDGVYQNVSQLTEGMQSALFCALAALRQADISSTLLGIDVSSLPAAAREALSDRVAECPTTPDPTDPGCLVAPFLDVCDIVQGQSEAERDGTEEEDSQTVEACRAERTTTTQAASSPATTSQPPDTPEPFIPPGPEVV